MRTRQGSNFPWQMTATSIWYAHLPRVDHPWRVVDPAVPETLLDLNWASYSDGRAMLYENEDLPTKFDDGRLGRALCLLPSLVRLVLRDDSPDPGCIPRKGGFPFAT